MSPQQCERSGHQKLGMAKWSHPRDREPECRKAPINSIASLKPGFKPEIRKTHLPWGRVCGALPRAKCTFHPVTEMEGGAGFGSVDLEPEVG